MVLALNVSVYFCKLLPLHMNGNLPVGIGMHVFAMICDLISQCPCYQSLSTPIVIYCLSVRTISSFMRELTTAITRAFSRDKSLDSPL
eukprot:UN4639